MARKRTKKGAQQASPQQASAGQAGASTQASKGAEGTSKKSW
jgi:hypothetical protein